MLRAGSTGGAQPPHEPPRRQLAYCESAPDVDEDADTDMEDFFASAPASHKGRGPAKGLGIDRRRQLLGGAKIPLKWDKYTGKAVGQDAKLYRSGVGIYVRSRCDPFYKAWKDVPGRQHAQVLQDILDNFTPVDSIIAMRDAKKCYNGWKSSINGKIRLMGDEAPRVSRCDATIASNQWEKCLQRHASKEFQDASKRNKCNREKLTTPSFQGREPYAAHREKTINEETNPTGVSFIELYKQMHQRSGQWVNEYTAESYRRMKEMESSMCIDGGRLSPDQERNIMETILGRRRGYIPGMGPSPPSSQIFATTSHLSVGASSVNIEDYERLQKKHDQMASTLSWLLEYVKAKDPTVELPNVHVSPLSEDDPYTDEHST